MCGPNRLGRPHLRIVAGSDRQPIRVPALDETRVAAAVPP